MSSVKQPSTMLMGQLLKQSSRRLVAADIDGLRASRLRLMGEVPREGSRITELAERLGMTKQACGQLVTDLVGSGHVNVSVPPDDRRSRVVRVTARGRRAVAASVRSLATVDREWAAQVGEPRFEVFREVLAELADRARDDRSEDGEGFAPSSPGRRV